MSFQELTTPDFACHVDPDRHRVFVRPCGELDLATVDRVEDELTDLRDAGFDRFVVDLSGVTFLDSSGLGLLLRWSRAASLDGLTFSVAPGPPDVMRVMELTGVLDEVTIAPARRFARDA